MNNNQKLGKKGDIIEANDGYARNYIIPQKIGVEANGKNLNDLKLQHANEEKLAAEKLAKAQQLKEELADKKVVLEMKVGEGGRTFGSVSTKEIADAAKEQLGLTLDKKKMSLPVSIKQIGTYTVQLKLHAKVTAELTVNVVEKH